MDRRLFIVGGAAAVAAAGAAWYFGQGSAPGTTSIATVTPVAGEAEVDTSGVTEMMLGSPEAPVTLTEYASFTCPHCANFHANVYDKLKTNYIDTGKVKFVFRDVYFDQFGLWAAMVARCAGPERFFGVADMMFDQQKDWIGDGNPQGISQRLRKIGMISGLEKEELDACLADEDKARELVAWYQKNATADEITGTPTLIIDGEKHSNMTYDDLAAILDAKLEG
ncbi:DsbA family protein [Pseudooceanicola sp. C21-150M6]|uniref:DsbA family protein n=1 Tax=Pseudooceanicola sp. C21-150M6 TaxID=3434355 RepID=UPI003D7FD228